MFELLADNVFIQHSWLIPVILFLGTFVLEDAAIVSGVMLVSDGLVHPEIAFIALLTGITAGDALLYAAGHYSGKFRFIRSWLKSDLLIPADRWLRSNLFFTIFLVRFAPGLRLPCYLACGWFSVSLKAFILSVTFAGFLWVSFVFGSLYWLGEPVWNSPVVSSLLERFGVGRWVLIPLVVAVLYGVQWACEGHSPKSPGD